ncbi:MAG: FMN-binding protein [Gammaproteobacteria bacterium]|nr:FMN-binding protein [Gammaproteobacteria bacterium]MDH4254651.1 FMN-binding protein [Gammaproteobacteria bacterium]MDH5308334.1 FMN-binding protein [Gammaproteobacteria bacterium]
MKHNLILLVTLLAGAATAAVYQEPVDFVSEAFDGTPPAPDVLWLTGTLGVEVEQLLGHAPFSKRLRYWSEGSRSVWILDEIGKEQPITTGFVIENGRIEHVRVLVFRESRGWEVRHEFFTNQFKGASMNGERTLDRSIDGISGATLSVRAVEKLARVALLLDSRISDRGMS